MACIISSKGMSRSISSIVLVVRASKSGGSLSLFFFILLMHHLMHGLGYGFYHFLHHVVGMDRVEISLDILFGSGSVRWVPLGQAIQPKCKTQSGGKYETAHSFLLCVLKG